jgi:hypothetical protein
MQAALPLQVLENAYKKNHHYPSLFYYKNEYPSTGGSYEVMHHARLSLTAVDRPGAKPK